MNQPILALDQGTSSSRAIVFEADGSIRAVAQTEFAQHYPRPGWVEHDPEEIWSTTLEMARRAIAEAGLAAGELAGIGITNQRETVVLWDRATGEPVHPAIVWQDRRTADICERLRSDGLEGEIRDSTGLLLDPYFSATKLAWLLDHVPQARARAERGELACGTIDSWLVWKLTDGRVHVTDATNASRTLLYDIVQGDWSDALLNTFQVPRAILPEVVDSSGVVAESSSALLGASLPIAGIAGDQQSALFGQACLSAGGAKSTYGTGCFAMAHTGHDRVYSRNRLLTTVAARLDGRDSYAIEGSIFVAGAAVKWLRDQLGVVATAAETEAMARSIGGNTGGVYVVPAFAGLGAPWWDAEARGMICGLTLDTGVEEIVTATLRSVVYQTRDLMDAMTADGARPAALRVDGGMVVNDWLCQTLADVLEIPIERPAVTETTALGAAYLAGLATGVYGSADVVSAGWSCERRFEPALDPGALAEELEGWRAAVARARTAEV